MASAVVSPVRVVSAGLLATGALLVWVNRRLPDASQYAGVLLIAVAIAGIVARPAVWAQRLVAWSALATLFCAGAEGMLRRENARTRAAFSDRFVQFVGDPELKYTLAPHRQMNVTLTNSFGMIDVERQTARAVPDTFRVACLGDSVGGDVSIPTTNVCAELESMLRTARGGRATEVLNFSVPGYNTMQEARALEVRAEPFAPDAVVLLYVVNDPFPDLAISNYLPGHVKFLHMVVSGARAGVMRVFGSAENMITPVVRSLHASPDAWDAVTRAGFDRIARYAKRRNIPVVVAVFPLFTPDYEPGLHGVYDQVARAAQSYGFRAVNLRTEAYAGTPYTQWLRPVPDIIHPNAAAHHRAAEVIAPLLAPAATAYRGEP